MSSDSRSVLQTCTRCSTNLHLLVQTLMDPVEMDLVLEGNACIRPWVAQHRTMGRR